jgi:hypothetical protein
MANKQFNSVDGYSVGNATVIIDDAGNVSATSQITRNSRNVPTHVFQANTPPANALVGDQWYNTDNGILFEYLNDGTTIQWVDVNGQPGVIASTILTTANTVTDNAQPNITSVGTLTSLDVSGNIIAANITANTGVFTGNGSGLSAIAGANVTGQVANALVAGTVYTNAQPNITSVGNLTALTVTGNTFLATTSGNVGIGVSSASTKMDVDGGEVRIGQQTAGTGAWLNVNLRDGTSASAGIRVSERSSASGSESIPVTQPHLLLTRGSDGLGSFIKFTNQQDGYSGIGSLATTANGHDIRLYTGTGTEKLIIDANGNVGIGASSPASRLDVAGSVRFGTNFQWDNANNRLGIGTTTPSTALNIVSSSVFSYQFILDATSNETALANHPVMSLINNGTGNNNGGGIRFRAADTDGTIRNAAQIGFLASGKTTSSIDGSLYFMAGGLTERMRITASGNVGIGTSSPGELLDVQRSADAAVLGRVVNANTGTSADARIAVSNGTTQSGMIMRGTGHASANHFVLFQASPTQPMTFFTNGAERLRVDASGNVGIGTTAPASILHASSSAVSSDVISENTNSGISSSNKYGFAIREIGSEKASFRYFRDGTGNAELKTSGPLLFNINNAERMRIDGSGNVGIGTSSPGGKLDVVGGTDTLRVTNTDAAAFSGVGFHDNVGVRAQIWAGGSSYASFGGAGSLNYSANSGPHVWYTNYAERARIDSSGNLLVGTTTQLVSTRQTVVSGSNGVAVQVANGAVGSYMTNTSGTGDWQPFSFNVNGTSFTQVGSITITGGTTTNYNTSSDARLKHDIVDAPDAADLIDAIKVRSFKWNADNSEQRYGFVAQELLEVAPEAVHVPADEDQMMGVDYSKLVPMLIKELQSLRTRVAQLEGK